MNPYYQQNPYAPMGKMFKRYGGKTIQEQAEQDEFDAKCFQRTAFFWRLVARAVPIRYFSAQASREVNHGRPINQFD